MISWSQLHSKTLLYHIGPYNFLCEPHLFHKRDLFRFFFSSPFDCEIPVWENLCYAASPASSPQEPSAGFYFQSRSKFHRFSSLFFYIVFSCKQERWTKENRFRVVYNAFRFPLKQSHGILALNLQLLEGFFRKVGSDVCVSNKLNWQKINNRSQQTKKPFENIFSVRHNMNNFSGLFQFRSSV